MEEKQNLTKVVAENLTLVGILKWLEEKHKLKKSGKPFNIQDIEGYIRREQIPLYLGGYKIVLIANKYNKLYKLVDNKKQKES